MSYCRNDGTTSDVYVVGSFGGSLTCYCNVPTYFTAKSKGEMLKHLEDHRSRGDKVPSSALDRLKREIREAAGYGVEG